MRYMLLSLVILMGVAPVSAQMLDRPVTHKEVFQGLPFKMDYFEPPAFPDRTFNIEDYGALSHYAADNTKPINDAITACSNAGGGTVIVPPGTWHTGAINLKSNVNLHLQRDARIQFSSDLDDYPLVWTRRSGTMTYLCSPFIYGKDLENVAITGPGIIDGDGSHWRMVKKEKMNDKQWKNLTSSQKGVVQQYNKSYYKAPKLMWHPKRMVDAGEKEREISKNAKAAGGWKKEHYQQIKARLRPILVQFFECRNVLIDGPTIQDSPFWNTHIVFCENVTVRNARFLNQWWAQNGDGCNFDSCRNAVSYNNFFSTGDDSLAIKSGKNEEGRRIGRPSENIVIVNNHSKDGHGGITIGSEMSGGVRNVFARNCTLENIEQGIWFKSCRGRGGVVENVWIRDIEMDHVERYAIFMNTFYGTRDETIQPVDEGTPIFRNIDIRNINCKQVERKAIEIKGLPEMPLQNLHFENITSHSNRDGAEITDVADTIFKNLTVSCKRGPAILVKNAKNITFENPVLTDPADTFMLVEGQRTQNIQLLNPDMSKAKEKIRFDAGASENAVTIK